MLEPTLFFRVENISVGPWEVLGPGHHAPNLTEPHKDFTTKGIPVPTHTSERRDGRLLSLNHNNALS